jgi:tetratricopeptide (TPR) repeat protein
MLVWYDHADEEHSEKYILLVAYTIGLSLGVHQLALLTIFPVFMLIYYRRRQQVTIGSWLGMVAASVITFIVAYKIVLSKLVDWLGEGGSGSIFAILLIAATIGGIIYSQKAKKPILNLSLWSALLILMGYTTYATIIVRANQDPPMNENSPKTLAQFTRFINREQYGSRDFLPRRYPTETGERNGPTWERYTSDGDFFWRYQTDHMYNRYLYWNFIGRAGEAQDSGTDWSKTWGIPFLLGVFGMYWHFKRDPKRALTFLAAFIMLGWMTAWYQNQQDPQPRERDYFYVGAFYMYAIWVGIGATGLIELLRSRKKAGENEETPVRESENNFGIVGAAFLLLLLAVPLNQCLGLAGMAQGKSFEESSKWAMYSRSGNYVPFDYAYNILQSCEHDAILFTYGDNDTFPLWCLQDVYGIRRDVRIVQLSLSNTGWYIEQLKNKEPWGAKKVALPSFSDESLLAPENSRLAPQLRQGTKERISVQLSAEATRRITGDSSRGPSVLQWVMSGSYGQGEQQLYTISDQVALDIIRANINTRPVYFSVTVPENNRLGMADHLIGEGLAMRVTPDLQQVSSSPLEDPLNLERTGRYLLDPPATPSSTARLGMFIRTYNDPIARRSNQDNQYAINYLLLFVNYAQRVLDVGQAEQAVRALDTLLYRFPPELVRASYYPIDIIAAIYDVAGQPERAKAMAERALARLGDRGDDPEALYTKATLAVYAGRLDEAKQHFERLKVVRKESEFAINLKIMEVEARKLELAGKKREAYDLFSQILEMTGIPEEQLPADFLYHRRRRAALAKELGITTDTAAR